MKAPTRIHHINFVVHDLDAAIDFYQQEMGLPPFAIVEHSLRGSRIARSPVGDTWFVLVCPDDELSVPGQHLEQHGEGFFLISFGVDDLAARVARIEESGRTEIRQGILDWRIADVGTHFGANLQLTDDH